MERRRVVVTGIGALTPIGNTSQDFWNGLVEGKSGAAPITHFDASKFKTQFACELKGFNIEDFMDRKEARKLDKFAQYASVVSDEAIKDAHLDVDKVDKDRVGVIWGSGIGGLETFQNEVTNFNQGDGTPRFNPFFIPKMIADIASGMISIKYGFRGPNFTTVSACASAANAMIDALNYIRFGYADVIVSGGSEAAVTIAGIGGFNALHALSTFNENPAKASRPFDANRDGFVLGEGAGAIVLEEYNHAVARGATIYCELAGGGLSADAHHMTAPHPEGLGAKLVMNNCLKDAGVAINEVDAINMHGTSTPLGDIAESKAVIDVFGEHAYNININSTKSMTGHLLGAAGAVEAIATIEAMRHNYVPMTAGTSELSDYIEANVVYGQGLEQEIPYAISNTFGFGGHNAVLAFKRWENK